MAETIIQPDLQDSLPLIARGKVRDLYEVNDKTLLFVATDRISAYDVVMANVRVSGIIPIEIALLICPFS